MKNEIDKIQVKNLMEGYYCGTMTYNLNGQNLMNGNQVSFNYDSMM